MSDISAIVGLPEGVWLRSWLFTKLMDALASNVVTQYLLYQPVGQLYWWRLERIEARYCAKGHRYLRIPDGSSEVGDTIACARCGAVMQWAVGASSAGATLTVTAIGGSLGGVFGRG